MSECLEWTINKEFLSGWQYSKEIVLNNLQIFLWVAKQYLSKGPPKCRFRKFPHYQIYFCKWDQYETAVFNLPKGILVGPRKTERKQSKTVETLLVRGLLSQLGREFPGPLLSPFSPLLWVLRCKHTLKSKLLVCRPLKQLVLKLI